MQATKFLVIHQGHRDINSFRVIANEGETEEDVFHRMVDYLDLHQTPDDVLIIVPEDGIETLDWRS